MCWQLFIFYICPDCDLPVLFIAVGVVNRYAKEVKVFERRWGDPDCGVLFGVSTPARERRTEVRSPMSFFYEDINPILGPLPSPPRLNLIISPKSLFGLQSHWGIKFKHVKFERTQFSLKRSPLKNARFS